MLIFNVLSKDNMLCFLFFLIYLFKLGMSPPQKKRKKKTLFQDEWCDEIDASNTVSLSNNTSNLRKLS